MSCGHIAVILKENAGEIPMETMDKKYVNPKSVKETKNESDSRVFSHQYQRIIQEKEQWMKLITKLMI